MLTRILTALVLAPVVLGLCLYLPTTWFAVVLTGIVVLGSYEWNALTSRKTVFLAMSVVWFGFLLLWLTDFFSPVSKNALSAALIACVLAAVYWFYQVFDLWRNGLDRQLSPNQGMIEGVALLSAFFIGMILLHQLNPLIMVAAMVSVWAADSCAYFAGKFFGKTPLAPNLSPKKTIEGVVGGALGSIVILCVFAKFVITPMISGEQFGWWIIAGLIAALISVAGDLFQSRLKRIAGVKDSGHILPGHGGILDRIDGLIAAIPVFVTIWFSLA